MVEWKFPRRAIVTLEGGEQVEVWLGDRRTGPIFCEPNAWFVTWMAAPQVALDWESEWSRLDDPPERYVLRMQILAALPGLHAEIGRAYVSADVDRLLGFLAQAPPVRWTHESFDRSVLEGVLRGHFRDAGRAVDIPRVRIVSVTNFVPSSFRETIEVLVDWEVEHERVDPESGTTRVNPMSERFRTWWGKRDDTWKVMLIERTDGFSSPMAEVGR